MHAALIEAGQNRMRPNAMATFCAVLTLLPLALGGGSAMKPPLAVAIVAGLAAQLPLVPVVMPVLHTLLRRAHG